VVVEFNMPKIVIVGSCRFAPYQILITPSPWNSHIKKLMKIDHEKAAKLAERRFHPAIRECDEVWVYAPDGIGQHTQRDVNYARKHAKKIFVLQELRFSGE